MNKLLILLIFFSYTVYGADKFQKYDLLKCNCDKHARMLVTEVYEKFYKIMVIDEYYDVPEYILDKSSIERLCVKDF